MRNAALPRQRHLQPSHRYLAQRYEKSEVIQKKRIAGACACCGSAAAGRTESCIIYKNPCLCFVRIVIMFFKRVFRGQKICLRYFEICLTYFKIQGTYFLFAPIWGLRTENQFSFFCRENGFLRLCFNVSPMSVLRRYWPKPRSRSGCPDMLHATA